MDRPDLSERMVKWALELGEYGVEFKSLIAIKAQALADFLQETTRALERKVWKSFMDSSVTKKGWGVGVQIISPDGDNLKFAVLFAIHYSTKAVHMLATMGADSQFVAQQITMNFEVKEDHMFQYVSQIRKTTIGFATFDVQQIPREENKLADELA